MSDFYTVLRQSIIDRGLRSADEREEAYAQAREAMVRRLWSYDPPLAPDEIDARIGQFDASVQQIEDDVAEVFAAMPSSPYLDDEAPPAGDYDEDAAPLYPEVAEEEPPPRRAPERGQNAEEAALADFIRSLEARSRAVERALSAPPGEVGHPFEDEPAPEVDDDEEVADPARTAPDADDDGDLPEAVAHPSPPSAPRRMSPSPRPPAPVPAVRRPPQAKAPPASRPAAGKGRIALLAGIVAVLALLLAGGVVWVFFPGLVPGATLDPVALQTDVPGGVSDPDTAVRIPTAAIVVDRTFTLFDGADPTAFVADPDNPVRYDGKVARIATSVASAGAKVIVGAGLSSRLAGRTVRVTIEARSARENGASTMRFAYQSGLAISHWQTANLSEEFTPLGLVWRVPSLRTSPSGDAILIEPGIPGSGAGVEIGSVTIDLVGQ